MRQLEMPVLGLYGSEDFRVDADGNLAELRIAIKDAPTKDVALVKLPGLDHSLVKRDRPDLWGLVDTKECIDPSLLKTMDDWLDKHFHPTLPKSKL